MAERIPFRCIGVKEADALLRDPRTVTLDVRDAGAYGAGHVEGARNITFSGLSELIMGTPKAAPVLIYCYHGHASREFAQTLSDFGFREVYSLDGGYEAWRSWVHAQAPTANAPTANASTGTPDATLARWLAGLGFPSGGVNATVENGMTPLMKAAREGLGDIVGGLVALGAALDQRNTDGNTALWLACVGSHLDIISALAAAGIDIDNRNDNGATALMYASSAGKADVVARLLELGADPLPETLDGFSALDLAATAECLTLLRGPTKAAKAARAPA
ncbi:ankyrin repeat domain-containing protein [Xanthobacter sp. V2C-8]|uniref:ankyrin repeat domain-containing protein n=1 Tax=Xanthobacter albus TaxID=3119929 RepID=UPI00372832A3